MKRALVAGCFISVAFVLVVPACGSSSNGDGDDTQTGGDSGTDTSTNDAISNDSGGDSNQTCTADTQTTTLSPLDVIFMMDESGSMSDPSGSGGSKYQTVSPAIETFVSDSASANIGFGMEFFGKFLADNVTADCVDTDYSTLDVPVAAVVDAGNPIVTALNLHSPSGGEHTTYAALKGILEAATAQSVAHPDHEVAVFMLTDSPPDACDMTTADIDGLASAAFGSAQRIKTFVLGLNDSADATFLSGIADAGGTTTATIVDLSTNGATLTALDSTRTSALPCSVGLPAPKSGTADYAKVNVTRGASTLSYVGNASSCASADGWYYDVDPFADAATPHKIELCPTTCAAVRADAATAISVVQGCTATQTADGGAPH